MSEPTNAEVVLWLQGKDPSFKQRGPVTQRQADAYNRLHPDRPYTGPVKKVNGWARGNQMARSSQIGYGRE